MSSVRDSIAIPPPSEPRGWFVILYPGKKSWSRPRELTFPDFSHVSVIIKNLENSKALILIPIQLYYLLSKRSTNQNLIILFPGTCCILRKLLIQEEYLG